MCELFKLALTSLGLNKLRAGLTMFGIIWGIATVIILVSVISGFAKQNQQMWKDMGVNLLIMEYAPYFTRDGTRMPLTPDPADAAFIEEYNPLVRAAAPQVEEWRQMQVGAKKDFFGISATTPHMRGIRDYRLAAGRFFGPIDYDNCSKVAVVGCEVKNTLWGEGASVLGKQLAVSGVTFTVIGEMERRRGGSDHRVFIPLSTYEKSLARLGESRGRGNFSIYAALKNQMQYDATQTMLRRMLAARHGFDPSDEEAIRFRDFSRWRQQSQVLLLMMFIVSYFVGVTTLAVGAVGVMNIMLVSVGERVREIGLRKALGAPSGSILGQFLLEALILTLAGGFFGIVLGLTLVGLLRLLPLPEQFPTPVITANTICIAVVVNVVVGLIAGTYPARQAALLDPIVALRTD
ncbi:MAG: hypothetical protein B1H03_00105 [Planctomycetales bacterium 4484_113]|nr:MAG: hypothetical protein B1H03_00105 [Planctomycetales bacterium 4484_113]